MGQRRHSILDVLTSALLYATMMVGGLYLYIFIEPQSFINPFPPPQVPVRAVLATETPLPTPTFIPTVVPTNTAIAPTAIVVLPEPTIAPTVSDITSDRSMLAEPSKDTPCIVLAVLYCYFWSIDD